MRLLGAPRLLCVLACFCGSGILHAWPQYASTGSLLDTSMMFGFFLCQGILLLVELIAYILMTGSPPETIKGGGIYTKASYQWLVEMIIISGLLSTVYMCLESHLNAFIRVSAIACICLLMLGAILQLHINIQGKDMLKSPSKIIKVLLGWIWATSCVVLTLPLFSIPVFHALGTMYDRSYLIGPLLRAIFRVYTEQNAHVSSSISAIPFSCMSFFASNVTTTAVVV